MILLKMTRVCVISSSRADYGLLSGLLKLFDSSHFFDLKLIVCGMHLTSEFGMTSDEIYNDGFDVSWSVEMLLSSDTKSGVAKSIGLGTIGFTDAYTHLKPNLIVLLGDRYEILSAATAALALNIPIAHIHGGEVSHGAIDDTIRHCITKMSHLHFVATEKYRQRVIQLGEDPSRVHNVGGLGIDNAKTLPLIEKYQLEKNLDFKFKDQNLIITYHPTTLSEYDATKEIEILLKSLNSFKEVGIIFTAANADAGGRHINKMIVEFCEKNSNAKFYLSLGHLNYLSCVKCVDGVVGNSSSALIEAPYFKKGSVNIGARQDGRIKADSIIDSKICVNEIKKSINLILSTKFQEKLYHLKSPYGYGGAYKKIIKHLKKTNFDTLINKNFYDIK